MSIFTVGISCINGDGIPMISVGNVEAGDVAEARTIAWQAADRLYPAECGYRRFAVVADPFTPISAITHLEAA